MNVLAFILAVSALIVVIALAVDFVPEIIAEAKVRHEEEDYPVWTALNSDVGYYTEFDAHIDMCNQRIFFRELANGKMVARHGAHRRV